MANRPNSVTSPGFFTLQPCQEPWKPILPTAPPHLAACRGRGGSAHPSRATCSAWPSLWKLCFMLYFEARWALTCVYSCPHPGLGLGLRAGTLTHWSILRRGDCDLCCWVPGFEVWPSQPQMPCASFPGPHIGVCSTVPWPEAPTLRAKVLQNLEWGVVWIPQTLARGDLTPHPSPCRLLPNSSHPDLSYTNQGPPD